MSRAVLALGSNLGDRLGHLRTAVRVLSGHVDVRRVSAAYESVAVGGPSGQPDFLNAVVLAEGDLSAPEWLALAGAAERTAGRLREQRWGPRTLDVDLIDVDGLTLATPDLHLPHPRAAERAFVLVPWLELDPAARLPDGTRVDSLVRGDEVLVVAHSAGWAEEMSQ